MATDPVTPIPGLANTIVIGGTPVDVIDIGPNGGFITNPANPVDQGIGAAESLYVNPVSAAGVVAFGTTFEIPPGATWTVIPGQTTKTSVNANTTGHRFSVVSY